VQIEVRSGHETLAGALIGGEPVAGRTDALVTARRVTTSMLTANFPLTFIDIYTRTYIHIRTGCCKK